MLDKLPDSQLDRLEHVCAAQHAAAPDFYSALAEIVQHEIARRAGNGKPSIFVLPTPENLSASLREAMLLRDAFEISREPEGAGFAHDLVEQLIELALVTRDAQSLSLIADRLRGKLSDSRATKH